MNSVPLWMIVLGWVALPLLSFLFGLWAHAIWRRGEQERATEIKITQVDQEARNGVEGLKDKMRTENAQIYVDMQAGDGETRQAMARMEAEFRTGMSGLNARIAGAEEGIRHLPTQSDLARLREDVAELKASSAANGARQIGMIESMNRLEKSLSRLEDHAMASKP